MMRSDLQPNQLGRQRGMSIVPPFGVASLEEEVLARDPAEFAKALPQHLLHRRSGRVPEHADAIDLPRLLRLGGERRGEETP